MLMILRKDFFIERCTSTGSGHISAVVLPRFSGKSLLKEERHLQYKVVGSRHIKRESLTSGVRYVAPKHPVLILKLPMS